MHLVCTLLIKGENLLICIIFGMPEKGGLGLSQRELNGTRLMVHAGNLPAVFYNFFFGCFCCFSLLCLANSGVWGAQFSAVFFFFFAVFHFFPARATNRIPLSALLLRGGSLDDGFGGFDGCGGSGEHPTLLFLLVLQIQNAALRGNRDRFDGFGCFGGYGNFSPDSYPPEALVMRYSAILRYYSCYTPL